MTLQLPQAFTLLPPILMAINTGAPTGASLTAVLNGRPRDVAPGDLPIAYLEFAKAPLSFKNKTPNYGWMSYSVLITFVISVKDTGLGSPQQHVMDLYWPLPIATALKQKAALGDTTGLFSHIGGPQSAGGSGDLFTMIPWLDKLGGLDYIGFQLTLPCLDKFRADTGH